MSKSLPAPNLTTAAKTSARRRMRATYSTVPWPRSRSRGMAVRTAVCRRAKRRYGIGGPPGGGMDGAADAPGRGVTDRDVEVTKGARDRDGSARGVTTLAPMPRIPRLRRGEEDVPPEAHAEEQAHPDQPTQQLTSGDPLAAPPPPPVETAAPSSPAVTSGDPLAGAA